MSGITHKELLFVPCSTDWRLWYLVASDFAFVSSFFCFDKKRISTEARLADLPNTSEPLTTLLEVASPIPLIVRLQPGRENRTVRAGMPKKDTKK